MPAHLLSLTDGPSILIDKPVLLFGRHAECDVQLNSKKVSRRHCCLAQVNDYLVIRDLGSTNGVRINGNRVIEGKLNPGDELTIGNFRYKIQVNGSAPAAPLEKFASIPMLAQQPNLVPVDHLESCEIPVALAEDSRRGPVPQSLPLVLPVNGAMKPGNIGLPLSGDFRAGPPPQ